jgi:hypothetical protein
MTAAAAHDQMTRDWGYLMSDGDDGPPTTTVAIIGAGFGGICMAIKLGRAGIPYTIFEKAPSVGGVWRDNVYPGAACDWPSNTIEYRRRTRFFDAGNYDIYPPLESRPLTASDAAGATAK